MLSRAGRATCRGRRPTVPGRLAVQSPNAASASRRDRLVIAIADGNQRRGARAHRASRETRGRRRPSAPTATARCRAACGRTASRRTAAARTRDRRRRRACRAAGSAGSAAADGRGRSPRREASGAATTSASSSRPRPANRLSAVRPTSVASAPMSVSNCAPIRAMLLVHLDGRPRARALVEHVGGDRRETFLAGRIVGRAAPDEQQEPDQRHAVGWRTVHTRKAVRERRLVDRGKRETRDGAKRRQPRAVHDGRRRRASRDVHQRRIGDRQIDAAARDDAHRDATGRRTRYRADGVLQRRAS